MEDIDQKIIRILHELREVHKESEKYYATQVLSDKPIVPHDIYPMALAFDTEKKIYLELNLARSEKFPGRFTSEEIENIKKEIDGLAFNIKAWSSRKFPCQYTEDTSD